MHILLEAPDIRIRNDFKGVYAFYIFTPEILFLTT